VVKIGRRGYGSKLAVRTGIFIRDYLQEHQPCYIQEIHRAFKEYKKKKGLRPPSLASFRSYFLCLRKLGLIEFVREGDKPKAKGESEKILEKFQRRKYFKIVLGQENSPFWNNPQFYLRRQESSSQK